VLDAGADIDQRSDWWAGSFGVLDSAADDLAAYLIERGATLTPHAAARLGLIDALHEMIEADPSCVHELGGDGQRPLHFARTVEIADLLLDAGAVLDARDVDHESTAAQWLATARPEVAAHLLARGCEADPFLATLCGALADLADLVDADPQALHARVSRERFSTEGERAAEHIYFYTVGEGCSLLHAAALTDGAETIRWLCERGADPGVRGGYDASTALHTAAWNDAAEAAEALLDHGADLNAPSGDIHRNEPLGWAIVSGASNAFRVLLERGARVRDAHRRDAEAGARGNFRTFSPGRGQERWDEIHEVIRAVGP
jgi:ankyrin repeat protein